ncbi:MAG TPA: hypothetical protein VFB34_05170 [Chloroflexota bacterium]|nr:hypothetical protein [Chloroflexota bacterium]
MRDLSVPNAFSGSRTREDGRRDAPTRELALLLGGGLVTLAVWVVVLLTLSPARLLTYLAFFVPLWLAVTGLGGAASLWLRTHQGAGSPGGNFSVIRRPAMVATFLVTNLALLAGHHWSLVWLVVLSVVLLAYEAYTWSTSA